MLNIEAENNLHNLGYKTVEVTKNYIYLEKLVNDKLCSIYLKSNDEITIYPGEIDEELYEAIRPMFTR